MNEKKNGSGQWMFFVFGTFAVVAAMAISLIPSSLAYKIRLFSGVGLPVDFVEIVRMIILIATPLTVGVIGAIRVFAISDKNHADAFKGILVLEIAGMVFEILASLTDSGNVKDILSLGAQGFFLTMAIVCIFVAVTLAVTQSGWFKLKIQQNSQDLMFGEELHNSYVEYLRSPEGQAAVRAAARSLIHSDVQSHSIKLDPRNTIGQPQMRQPMHSENFEVPVVEERGNGSGKHIGDARPNA